MSELQEFLSELQEFMSERTTTTKKMEQTGDAFIIFSGSTWAKEKVNRFGCARLMNDFFGGKIKCF